MQKLDYPFFLKRAQVLIFLLLLITNSVLAQEDFTTESPYFTVFSNDSTAQSFPLVSTNVDATISGVIANVEIEQIYVNESDSIMDATYVFPMSDNAAIYSMQMVVGERVIDAVIKEKSEAEEIFEEANENGYTASLLEQNRLNVFQMSLANIQAGDSLKVLMTYTELINSRDGEYQFVLPSIVGPRFTTDGEEWVTQTANDSLAVSNTEWNINLNINAGMPLVAYCPSHEMPFNNQGHFASSYLSTNPGKDFIVNYSLRGNSIETGLLLYEGEEENFFLSIMQPPKPDVEFEIPKRDYVFIMDISGSMSGTPLSISKELISNLLNGLNLDDKFNILFFAGGSNLLSENSLYATAENIESAINFIDNVNAGGGTQLLPAMETALNMEGTENYSRIFTILTDGYVTVEKQAYDLIRENLNEANFFAFGIGTNVNRYIINGISYVGEAEPFVVTNMNDAAELANDFKTCIERPALTNLQASFDNINAYDIEPFSIPDIFAERPIIIYGKYDNADSGSITVTGDYSSGNVTSTLNFQDYQANADENIALKYLWARKRIKLMSDYGIASNEDDNLSLEEEITQLGLQYSLVTEYTSFVAVDSSSVANNGGGTDGSSVGTDDTGTDSSGGDGTGTDGSFSVDIEELENIDNASDDKNIQIIGNNLITDNVLKLKLSGIQMKDFSKLVLSIIGLDGSIVLKQELSPKDFEQVILLNFDKITQGQYFITLSSKNKLFDTERFIVMKK